jgi:hypothetical protein
MFSCYRPLAVDKHSKQNNWIIIIIIIGWLRNYATSWKVAISKPHEVIKFFLIYLILSAVGFTQPLTEMITSKRRGGKKFWEVERVRRVRLKTSQKSVSWLFRECGIFNISQTYRSLRPVTEVVLLIIIINGKAVAIGVIA